MIEFVKLTNGGSGMSVALRTEFGELVLSFRGAYTSCYTDVSLAGDGWAVFAGSADTKEVLARALENLTPETFEKLKAIGALSSSYQYEFLRQFEKISIDKARSLKEDYESVKRMVKKVVIVKGERLLILPGRVGPALCRTFVRCEKAGNDAAFSKAEVEWSEFGDALQGKGMKWEQVPPSYVWQETCKGLGAKKATNLLKELSEEGFRAISASVVVGRAG